MFPTSQPSEYRPYYFGSHHQPNANLSTKSLAVCAMLPIQHMCHPQWMDLANWFQIYRSAQCDAMWAKQYAKVNAMLKVMLKASLKCGTLPQCANCNRVAQEHLEFVSSYCMRMFTTLNKFGEEEDTDEEEVEERSLSDYDAWSANHSLPANNKKSNKDKDKSKPVESVPRQASTLLPTTKNPKPKKSSTAKTVIEAVPASPSSTASTVEATRSHRKSFVKAAAALNKYCDSGDDDDDFSDDDNIDRSKTHNYSSLITKSLMPVRPSPTKAISSRRKSNPIASATSSSAPPDVEPEVVSLKPVEKGIDDTLSDDQVAVPVKPKRRRASRAKKPIVPEKVDEPIEEELVMPEELAELLPEDEDTLNDLWTPAQEEETPIEIKPKRRFNVKRISGDDEPVKPKRRRNVKKRSLEEMTPSVDFGQEDEEAEHPESSSADFQPPMPKRWSSSMLLSKEEFDGSDAEPVLASNEVFRHEDDESDVPAEPKQPRIISTRVNLRGNNTDSGKLVANVRRSRTQEDRFVAELKRVPRRKISLLDIVGPVYLAMFSDFTKLSDRTYTFFMNDNGMALFKSRIAALSSIGEIVEIENA